MNYTLYTEKILPIARSLAAMQILADNHGEGDGAHPLSPLLEDFRLPLVKQLMLQSYIEMTINLRRYIDEAEIPQADMDFDRFNLSFNTPRGFGSVEADMLLSAMEQIIALGTVASVMRVWRPESPAAANAFSNLAAEYLARALSLLLPPFPKAILPVL
ncbi:MAG: hypothetical protein K2K68_01965 [Duncaniella sp.]|nr:hypothetical protein [Duncaniella sp.]